MPKEFAANLGSKALGCLSCISLAGERTSKAHNAEKQNNSSHTQNISRIIIFNADIDYLSHNQRHNQFKHCLDPLEEWTEKYLFFKVL